MKVTLLILFLSSSHIQSVAFLNYLISILIIAIALSSENKFLEPLSACIFLISFLFGLHKKKCQWLEGHPIE